MCQQTITGKRERFTRNIPLAKFATKRWQSVLKKYNVDADDAYQLALAGLWKACEGFDPSRGEKCWSSYAIHSIWSMFRVYVVEYYTSQKRAGSEKDLSLDGLVYEDGDKIFEPIQNDNAFHESLLSIIWDNIYKLKRKQWRDTLYMYYKLGMTFQEIGNSLGVSKQQAQQYHAKAIQQIREVLHVNY